ncbi:MAG: TonB C-terminal domain-containing protein, partial [Desulfuromonadales bacterium]|nr:TonB C-terminal domain-containing protein [Desulfuromonadales bacterium]NIS41107.1 TonB C-terminal domain-containing protein [Desulfuromonadales bacterium]
RLVDYKFLEKSGDRLFDESVKAAVLKSRELPKPPPVARWEVDVVFNL